MEDKAETKYFWLIELLAFWQGKVNSKDLIDAFGISATQAKKYLSAYNSLYPLQLTYNTSLKAHQPKESFSTNIISTDVAEYLDWLNGYRVQSTKLGQPSISTELNIPPRRVSPHVMRGLIGAIKQKKRVDVEYLSLNTSSFEDRVIQPHSLVKTGLRWHLRGYCEYRSEFRDFVLSRFRGNPVLMDSATHSKSDDLGWNTVITLRIQPDPRFSQSQKAIIEQDYQMTNGELLISTKSALAQYLIQEMHVRTEFLAKTPQQQQLVLVNESDLKGWLFG